MFIGLELFCSDMSRTQQKHRRAVPQGAATEVASPRSWLESADTHEIEKTSLTLSHEEALGRKARIRPGGTVSVGDLFTFGVLTHRDG